VDFHYELEKLLEDNLSEQAMYLWKYLQEQIDRPWIWDRPVSSSGKYHLREDGRVPTIIEHTVEMLQAAVNLLPAYPMGNRDEQDAFLLATALHDCMKYENKESERTSKYHDERMLEVILYHGRVVIGSIGFRAYCSLKQAIRYHHGQWSTDLKRSSNPYEFFISVGGPIAVLLHTLDYLSMSNSLKFVQEE